MPANEIKLRAGSASLNARLAWRRITNHKNMQSRRKSSHPLAVFAVEEAWGGHKDFGFRGLGVWGLGFSV